MANRHERVTELLSSYIDHQLSTDEQARVEAHLATCAACRRELQQWQRLVALLRACPQVRPPRAFALSLDVVASQGLILRLARFAPAVTALAAVLLAALLFADVRTLSQRSMPPASRPSLSVPSTALAVAIAATPPPAAAAPAASVAAPAMPTPAATEAVAREDVGSRGVAEFAPVNHLNCSRLSWGKGGNGCGAYGGQEILGGLGFTTGLCELRMLDRSQWLLSKHSLRFRGIWWQGWVSYRPRALLAQESLIPIDRRAGIGANNFTTATNDLDRFWGGFEFKEVGVEIAELDLHKGC